MWTEHNNSRSLPEIYYIVYMPGRFKHTYLAEVGGGEGGALLRPGPALLFSALMQAVVVKYALVSPDRDGLNSSYTIKE